ncbi:MAG TPA: nickel-type superoxide dismutase maturation protease [Pyrinomonadaceae bacterium]
MDDGIPQAGRLDRIRLVLGRFYGFRVEGDSMLPILRPGDKVLVDPKATLAPGDIVLARHPFRSSVRVLKRLDSVGSDGRLFLAGDNPKESEDSRSFGSVSQGDLLGKVVARLR